MSLVLREKLLAEFSSNDKNVLELQDASTSSSFQNSNTLQTPGHRITSLIHSYSSAFQQQTEENIKRVAMSHMFTSWQFELFVLQQRGTEGLALMKKYFPAFVFVMDLTSNPKFLVLSVILTVWNTIAVGYSLASCDLAKALGGYGLTTVVTPYPFIIAQIFLCYIWRGGIGYKDIFTRKEKYYKGNLKSLLAEMLLYMYETDHVLSVPTPNSEEKIVSFEQPESNFIYLLIGVVLPALQIVASVIYAINVQRLQSCMIYFYSTGGYFCSFFIVTVSGSVFLFVLNMLYIVSKVTSSLINSWINRYLPLQRMKNEDVKNYLQSSLFNGIKMKSHLLIDSIRRDAYERYLIVYYFLYSISQVLSGLVATILIISTIIFIWYLYLIFQVGSSFLLDVLVGSMVFDVALFFFTMNCITRTNSRLDKVYRRLKYAIPLRKQELDIESEPIDHSDASTTVGRDIINLKGDFEVIGGREEWLDYLTNNPLYWTVFGFPFTVGWIQTILLATIATVVGTIAPFLFASLSSSA